LRFRMGINLGDIIIEEDGDIYGDGVNVATRLEQIAKPGSIYISARELPMPALERSQAIEVGEAL
jgi:adenylate cyclase